MSYVVKEIFYSLQGEGLQSGRPTVFCRFAGCNLSCPMCDTDFHGTDGPGGGVYSGAKELAEAIAMAWPGPHTGRPFVVCTGGEPLLQVDSRLLDTLHGRQFEVAAETNGTILAPRGIDWLTISPKRGSPLLQRSGNELKLLYPQKDVDPGDYEAMNFEYFFLQPVDTGDPVATRQNTEAAVEFCLENPSWRLSLQVHKIVGIP
jgi:7-carboxy-7-deazaguanine synthase